MMKLVLCALIVILCQTVYSSTVLRKTRDDLNQAFRYCRNLTHLDINAFKNITTQVLLPEDDVKLQKLYECVAGHVQMIDKDNNYMLNTIENVAEAMIRKIIHVVHPDAQIVRFVAESAVKHCKNISKQNNMGVTIIKLSNCIRSYGNAYFSQ